MKRSKFSLSNYKLLTLNMGRLCPIHWHEVLPGDTIQHSTSALIRCNPLVAPVMHPVHVKIHHWFVPNRLIWEDWENFITGGFVGDGTPVHPYRVVDVGAPIIGSLADNLGVPQGITGRQISVLPFRAYTLIWNEMYRDQDIEVPLAMLKTSGEDDVTNTGMMNCNWEKDYFTTSRPWAQKGPDVQIPGAQSFVQQVPGTKFTLTDGVDTGGFYSTGVAGTAWLHNGPAVMGSSGATATLSPGVLQTVGGSTTTINDLREAFALQRFYEARAMYGSRYTEYLRYLGVKSSDARLQRPEYLGGGKQTIQFSEVLATAETDPETPIGSMKGHGIAALRSNRYRRFFEEHGIVMTLMSVMPKAIYTQGLDKKFTRFTRDEYYQKELQHLGMQVIENQELYGPHTDPIGVFGYQDRYDEYRRIPSSVAGEFRTSLNYWHFAREFATPPALNGAFLQGTVTNRPFADQTSAQMLIMASHSIQARRMLTKVPRPHVF